MAVRRRRADPPAEPTPAILALRAEAIAIMRRDEYGIPIVTASSAAVAPDGRWLNDLAPGERRPDAPSVEPETLDLGDYGDPAILASLIDKQLEAELLSQIQTVKVIKDMMPGDHLFGRIEAAKGAALMDEWTRRGKTRDDLMYEDEDGRKRLKQPEFKGF